MRKILLFIIVGLACSIFKSNAQVNAQDSLALVDFYDSTKGSGWVHHDNWLTKSPVTTWYGVTVASTRVVNLVLVQNNVYACIPNSIQNLTGLTRLMINDGYYSGVGSTISEAIGKLTNLKTLNLNSCGYSGQIPASIGNLLELDSLSLKTNELSGEIPSSIGNLSHLVYIDFNLNNNLSGKIPASIGKLIKLKHLDFGFNKLTGQIPQSFGKLLDLEYLFVEGNKLSGKIPSFLGYLKKLSVLDLGTNNFTGIIPVELNQLNQLQYFNLSNNQLRGGIPGWLSNLSNLVTVNLSNDFTHADSIPNSLQELSHLQEFYVNNDGLQGGFPSVFRHIPTLQGLNLSGNHLKGTLPGWLGELSNLKVLILSNNLFTGSLPSRLGNDTSLVVIEFANNKFSGSIPASLSLFKHLVPISQYCTFNNNNFTFSGMEDIAKAYSFATYSPQSNIQITTRNKVLSVAAGGTPSNNTFKWYKNGLLVSTKIGDSTLASTGTGNYNVNVTNSIAAQLTLYSDTVTISELVQNAKQTLHTNVFSVYPNPVKDVLNISMNGKQNEIVEISIVDMNGKVLYVSTKNLQIGTLTQPINVSSFSRGTYMVEMKTGEGTNSLKFVKE